MPNGTQQEERPVLRMADVHEGDEVAVVDEADWMHGEEGEVVYVGYGFASRSEMAVVRFRASKLGRDDREQSFDLRQLEIL